MPFLCVDAPAAARLLSAQQLPAPATTSQDPPCFHLDARKRTRRKHGQAPMLASLSLSTSPFCQLPCDIMPPAAQQEPELLQLPFGLHRGTTLLQYAWDGHSVIALDPEVLQPAADMNSQGQRTHLHQQHGGLAALRRWLLQQQDQLTKSFLPNRKDVNDDYWEWLQWRMASRFLTSTMQNLSTQSMLVALGLGAKKSVAASAAINWLLKDGVGRIARMTVATQFCQSFDSDLKRIRYVTSLIQSVLMCGEFVTPFFPRYFLPLASVSNVGKAISLAAFVAVAPSFQRALCRGNNLADLTAKNQAQHMVVDMLALGVSAVAMYFVRHSERARIVMPLLAFPVLAVADAWATYHELKSIELKALNRERAEMVADHWLGSGKVPTAYEISHEEHLLLPPDIAGGLLPLSITSLDTLVTGPQHAAALLQRYRSEQYLLTLQLPRRRGGGAGAAAAAAGGAQQQQRQQQRGGFPSWISDLKLPRLPWQHQPTPKLLMSLSESAEAKDILKAILEAAHLRMAVRHKLEAKLVPKQGQGQGGTAPGPGGRPLPLTQLMPGDQLWSTAGALLSERELDACACAAQRLAAAGLPRFMAALAAQGWKTRSFLLSTTEKGRYVALPRTTPKQKREKA